MKSELENKVEVLTPGEKKIKEILERIHELDIKVSDSKIKKDYIELSKLYMELAKLYMNLYAYENTWSGYIKRLYDKKK